MYKPNQQLQTLAPFIGLIVASAFVSAALGQLSGILYAAGHDTHSLLAAAASAAPILFIGYKAIHHRLNQPPTEPEPDTDPFDTPVDEVDVTDPLEQLWLIPTRRGGSPTKGREDQPTHDIEANARNLLGDEKYAELTAPVSVWRRMKNAVDFLIGSDDPKTLTGSWIAVILVAVAVFA